MKKTTLRIASRNSPLALKQAQIISSKLIEQHPNLHVEIIGMLTEGDKKLGMPLATVGGKGLFVKELEQALLEHRADIAVHSMKDVPVVLPSGLVLHTVCEREDPRDAFVSHQYDDFFSMPLGAVIGTASLRRQCLIKNLRPDLIVKILRGNVQTRLTKLANGEYDAIILATAGLKRLDLTDKIKHHFNPEIFIPAIGQGILGIECRADDKSTQTLLTPLHHQATSSCIQAERSLNLELQGGCQVPLAAYAMIQQNKLFLRAFVGHPDGSILLKAGDSSPVEEAEQLGKKVANHLLEHGAAKILERVYNNHG